MVGISLLTLVPGIVGGSETYARELVRGLARVGELEYRVLVPSIAPDAADGLPGREVTEYRASYSTPGRIGAMLRAALLPGSIRRQIGPEELDAVHYPLTVMLPRIESPPAVASVLDIQHVLFPRFFSRAERAYRALVYRWAASAPRVVVISEHVKETLVERLGADAARVRAIHLGIDHERFRPGDEAREPFLLYPANCWPHKNHERLFDAFARVQAKLPELRLVLTGHGHEGRSTPPGVDVRGRVSGDELAQLYRTASVVVFPSLYEGFGQPPLEAMACGCPVASSPEGALREVCGEAARYFDPRDPEAIAEGVFDVLASPDDWVRRGLERAAGFSWDRCARDHEAVYQELLP